MGLMTSIILYATNKCDQIMTNITNERCSYKQESIPYGNPYLIYEEVSKTVCKSGYKKIQIQDYYTYQFEWTYADIEYIPLIPGCVCPAPDQRKCVNKIQIGEPVLNNFWQSLGCL